MHLNAGVAGLVAAYVLGARRGYGSENLAPYDLSLAVIGTGLLWVGWLGFNGGSALGAGSRAGHAIVATHLAACAGVLTWMFLEWWDRGKPSVLGMISGAVAGLGTITPASGFVAPWHGIVIGIVAGGLCYWGCTKLKQKIGYDNSLDVFGVHGIGGATGTILVGVFAVAAIGEKPGLIEGNGNAAADPALWRGRDPDLVRRRHLRDPEGDRLLRAAARARRGRTGRPRRHPARRSTAITACFLWQSGPPPAGPIFWTAKSAAQILGIAGPSRGGLAILFAIDDRRAPARGAPLSRSSKNFVLTTG